MSYELEGRPTEAGRREQVGAIVVTSGYFEVMRVHPHRGRMFSETDGVSGAPVVLINETFARKFWPGEDALGKRLRLVENSTPQPWLTVAGILPDILQNFQRPLDHDPLIYLPYSEVPLREMFIVARTRVPPKTLAETFRRSVQSLDRNLPVYEVRTLEDRVAETRLGTSLLSGMFTIFAGIALLLASVGLYAVVAHSISQRTQEIGIRMAIGGTRRDILRLVYKQGMKPLAIGLAIGLPAAFGVTHVLRRALIGVSPSDPLTFVAIVFVLIVAGILGCAIPARRAIRVDPIVALRYE